MELVKLGLSVWFDEAELLVGDSVWQKIDQGLAQSTVGVVVLSPTFFGKKPPRRELDALLAREMRGDEGIILPVWHGVSEDEVARYSPLLANRHPARSEDGAVAVARAIFRAIEQRTKGASAQEARAAATRVDAGGPDDEGPAESPERPDDGRNVVFISHASEDGEVAADLAAALEARGVPTWLDRDQLGADTLWSQINDGLLRADLGVVIISASFFETPWTRHELGALLARQIPVVAVLHEFTFEQLLEVAPLLGAAHPLDFANGLESVVDGVVRAREKSARGGTSQEVARAAAQPAAPHVAAGGALRTLSRAPPVRTLAVLVLVGALGFVGFVVFPDNRGHRRKLLPPTAIESYEASLNSTVDALGKRQATLEPALDERSLKGRRAAAGDLGEAYRDTIVEISAQRSPAGLSSAANRVLDVLKDLRVDCDDLENAARLRQPADANRALARLRDDSTRLVKARSAFTFAAGTAGIRARGI